MRTALYSDQAQLLEGPSPCGLRGVTYSEFDNKVGPRLKFQYPVDAISSDEFESFADYVIVGKHLCGKIITVRNDSVQFVNYSVAIDNRKYDRNTLLFAVGFVLDKDIDTVSNPYLPALPVSYLIPSHGPWTVQRPFEPVLEKVATNLVTVERESEYLFQEESKKSLAHLLETLYVGLLTQREVTYCINECNMLNVKLYSSLVSSPVCLRDYDVPVLVFQDVRILYLLRWDISISRVLHWIDGSSCIRKISDDADMDIECVQRSLRILHLYGCIIITGIFQFSNEFVLRCPDPKTLLSSALLEEIQHFSELVVPVASTDKLSADCDDDETSDTVRLMRFLCSFRPGCTIGELLFKHTYILKRYDVRRLVAVCEHHEIIRRIHKHPVLRMEGSDFTPGDEESYTFTGAATLESICFSLEYTAKEVLDSMKPCLVSK